MKHIFILLSLIAISCSKVDEPPQIPKGAHPCETDTIDLDTILLNPQSLEFIPYTGLESIYFKNTTGDEVKFEPLYPPKSHHFRKTDFDLICDEGKINNYTFVREQYTVSHICKKLNLKYYLNLYTYNSRQQPKFIDRFNFLFHEPSLDNKIDTAISLTIVANFKGNEIELGEEFQHQNYEIFSALKILNKTFTNVYKVIEPKENLLTEIYFNKDFGLIGFKDLDSELWVFDRFE